MNILKAKIIWYEDWANEPMMRLLVDRVPAIEELIFEKKGNYFVGEKDGVMSAFIDASDHLGSGGRTYNITMKDGSVYPLIGPWALDQCKVHREGFAPCMNTSITDNPEYFATGRGIKDRLVSLPVILEALSLRGGAKLVKILGRYSYIHSKEDEERRVKHYDYVAPPTQEFRFAFCHKQLGWRQSQCFKGIKARLKDIERIAARVGDPRYPDHTVSVVKEYINSFNKNVTELKLEEFVDTVDADEILNNFKYEQTT